MSKGSLEIICGSMFSGKTEELMRRLKRAEYGKQKILTIKHHIDDRFSYHCIASHNGNKLSAVPLESNDESLNKILSLAHSEIEVVGLDELHFFPIGIVEIIRTLIERGKRVICAGLDMDFRGEPFQVMLPLLGLADHITKLRAICVRCGKEANYSQRLINGQPAKYEDPIILVGASECYEARCRNCFVMNVSVKELETIAY